MSSAVCEHLHPHLHRGVGRQIPACHDRPRWHQRCGQWHQIISTLNQSIFFSCPPSGGRHPWWVPWSCNLHWRRCPGRSAHCKVSTFNCTSIIISWIPPSIKTYQYRQAHSLQCDVKFVFKQFDRILWHQPFHSFVLLPGSFRSGRSLSLAPSSSLALPLPPSSSIPTKTALMEFPTFRSCL